MTRARRCGRPRFRVHNLVRFEAGSLRGAGLALFKPTCGARISVFFAAKCSKNQIISLSRRRGPPGACIRARSPRMRIWRYATAPARTLRNDLLFDFLRSFDRKSGATAARGAGASGRGRRERRLPGPEGLGHGPKGRRAAGRAPTLVRSQSFDGYSSTFRDLPGRPKAGNVLTCGNADRKPRSTRGFLKSTRITEKTCGSRRA